MSGAVMVRSPFGAPAIAGQGEGNGNALQKAVSTAREAQEVQAMVIMAKQFPRDERVATQRVLTACARPTLANQAVYQFARGGSDVSGPSIRLAEAIAQCWGNLTYGFRELEQGDGESTVEAICWDIETNTRVSRVFKVPHVRHTRAGDTKLTDPRDVYELVANQAARRIRACILEVVPGDVVEAAVEQCKATQLAEVSGGDKATLADRIKAMEGKFAALGVNRAMLEAYTGRSLEATTPALIVQLGNVYKSIKDGISTVDAAFGAAMERVAEKAAKSARKRTSAASLVTTPTTAEAPKEPPAAEKAEAAPKAETANPTPPAPSPAQPAEPPKGESFADFLD